MASQELQEFAATVIEANVRGFLERRRYKRRLLQAKHDRSARRIQRAWRACTDRQVFRYYKDLIAFRQRGDPKEVLRGINPREAGLVDAAAGLHVRFRLGGSTFPPFIFYKIFTHRSVIDLGYFSPRSYASELPQPADELHNRPAAEQREQRAEVSRDWSDFEIPEDLREYFRPDGSVGYRSTRGWYRRVENNGWRPVAERLLVDPSAGSEVQEEKRREALRHFLPRIRAEERRRMQKERRRQWMLKLYLQGKVGQGQGGGDVRDRLEVPEGVEEELDEAELLQWSEGLDYDEYLRDWMATATTLSSQAFVPEGDSSYLCEIPALTGNLRDSFIAINASLAPFQGGPTPATGFTSGMPLAS